MSAVSGQGPQSIHGTSTVSGPQQGRAQRTPCRICAHVPGNAASRGLLPLPSTELVPIHKQLLNIEPLGAMGKPGSQPPTSYSTESPVFCTEATKLPPAGRRSEAGEHRDCRSWHKGLKSVLTLSLSKAGTALIWPLSFALRDPSSCPVSPSA